MTSCLADPQVQCLPVIAMRDRAEARLHTRLRGSISCVYKRMDRWQAP